ncbi:hypothetical protein PybrP1_008980 [[Pythium] brassicae (nom. inval.)]|nr:hypothetical protein PybrP1_008980 [[Pythium] brassicae (nom. inval.)]
MASLSDEEQQLIQRDRDENPGCFYSTALSQSCRSINGDSKCELVKKIFRQCPGRSKELISNRTEVTEDEHGGELSAGDFFNRERLDPRRGDESPFGGFFGTPQKEGEFEAQMSPFDFLRQEMLRPFGGFFGGAFGAGGDDDSGARGDIFDQFEREFERMPRAPQQPSQPRRRAPPANPPHYSFHPSTDSDKDADAKKQSRANEKRDIFEGYTGRVEEI